MKNALYRAIMPMRILVKHVRETGVGHRGLLTQINIVLEKGNPFMPAEQH